MHGSPDLNPTQKALFQLLWKISWITQLNFQVAFIGTENLLASDYLWGSSFGISAHLPSDQWQKEVINWMNTSLASLQSGTYNYARPSEFDVGPGIPSLKYIETPESPDMQHLCHKIKFRSEAHTSFSVFRLFLILGISLLLTALNQSLPIVISAIQKRAGKGLHKRLEWIETSAFQLQRMAAEGRGIGPWNGRQDHVPALADYGHLFNLTAQSLSGRRSRMASFETVARARGDERGAYDMLDPQGSKEDLKLRERRMSDGNGFMDRT